MGINPKGANKMTSQEALDILKNGGGGEAYEIVKREIAVNEILRKHIQVKQNFDMTTSIEIPNKEITVEEGIILAEWLCPSKK